MVLFANAVAILATKMLSAGGTDIDVVRFMSGLHAFTFQIHFYFAGSSDTAIGLGKLFGLEYLSSFNYPCLSKSAAEFWHRWHTPLSTFFHD